jgi:hypothetical protein
MLTFFAGGSKPFSDDSRLSVLMRRAMRNDDDRDKRMSVIMPLKEFLRSDENFSVSLIYCHMYRLYRAEVQVVLFLH